MRDQLLATLEVSKNYTLNVAGLMPEGAYSFKPAAGVWDFRELMFHIAYGIGWWEENQVKGNKTDWDPPVVTGNKKDAIAALENAFDRMKNTLHHLKPDEKVIYGFHATLDHITHHRGQAIVYLRCNNIVPPEYVY